MGNDFTNFFWEIARAILAGRDPYSVAGNVYPPAACLSFVVFGLLPKTFAAIAWLLFNVSLFARQALRGTRGTKIPLVWLGYTPLLFTFVSGQLDFFLWWLALFLDDDQWYAPLLAALITLKPQAALILLPVVLITWLRKNRVLLLKFAGYCAVLHSLPLLYDVHIYRHWLESLSQRADLYYAGSPGLFSLSILGLSVWVIIPIAVAVAALGFFLGKSGSLQANVLALPFGTWYNSVLLMGSAPWQLLILCSWLALILSYVLRGTYPFLIIPLAALVWTLIEKRKKYILELTLGHTEQT